jgi:small subunit ribosomal protein S5
MPGFIKRIIRGSSVAKSVTLTSSILEVSKVTKVTSGGREFRFKVTVFCANQKGVFGIGTGKSKELDVAKDKALRRAKKNLNIAKIYQSRTVFHDLTGSFGTTRVLIKQAKPGSGIIAGGDAKKILETIGYKDLICKIHGTSSNPQVLYRAIYKALDSQLTLGQIAKIRGKSASDILSIVGASKKTTNLEIKADNSKDQVAA